jgi:glycine betaine/proline transport system permease protein
VTSAPISLTRPVALRLSRGSSLAILFAAAGVLYVAFQGQALLPFNNDNPVFTFLNGVRDSFDANRGNGPIFLYLFDPIRGGIGSLVDVFTLVLRGLGWIGLTAIAGALGLILVSWRTAALMVGIFLAFGVLGLWDATIQTLALTLAAVILSLAIGIPLGILAGRSDRFMKLVSPVLDVMQIMPTFAYLAPLALVFLIGPATAVIATMIYSIPPAIRITALGIRRVPSETVEAAESLGSTRLQILRKVQLPMARSTIGLAVNQTIMMALSMIVITALIAAPGLGEKIIHALALLNTGGAFNAGIAIVLLAMVLDRLSASASHVTDRRSLDLDSAAPGRRRALVLGSLAVATAAVLIGELLPMGRTFPAGWAFSFQTPVNDFTDWIAKNLYPVTDAIKNATTSLFLDPLQTALTNAPWWLVVGFIAGIALIVSGRRAAIVAVASLVGIAGLQLWQHAMETLALVLVAVAITMIVGIALGVGGARSDRLSRVLRPINDAAQTMPSFVYLLPALALFGTTRFTAIMAAVIYGVPAVVRLVEDGIRGVPPTVIEAATAAGSSRLQMIWKVQLPVARRSLLVAANQGVVLVLAMVVIGGLVGAGALGYDVVAGFAQGPDFGKGMSAAVCIVLLGVLLDRVTQGAGGRSAEMADDLA